ncbi:uncharacterized protein PHACADRAFT_252301 [Phanerochaete carnosa HHB-10118-sp]|uniref:Uncharacterized protein n=1 Tax=Phanerochaete carnosa (strain HHB-10118-sp) TaxID=650164 RepID=K5X5Q5_PHACS|nr:uncharacterized protein PHACADRAFT_252301 [Phanerochaete carnosa HHB-10118-sp]EKM58187.1 hypothetical protein PHACADRAFT_252301 [Phanerochaete carnosa HHB-10118-sp]
MRALSYVSSPAKDDLGLVLHRSLLDAAAKADVAAFFAAADAGADVNAEDPSGRNVVGCAIAGERWQDADASAESFMLDQRLTILKALLRHDDVSLSVLNAPIDAMRGITPLGLAAWLNSPEIVRMLLCECPGLVTVDGMDSSGATPLMYAARDGRIQIAHDLLSLGARPDYRDLNHRSSIQFAQKHPQVLWLCESAVRRRRMSESTAKISTSSFTTSNTTMPIECHPRLALKPSKDDLLDMVGILNTAIQSSDLPQLSACLLPLTLPNRGQSHPPPILVNFPDAQGRSPVHYCMATSNPSLEILDALYLAGADVSLHSRSGEGTPLHCLARHAKPVAPDMIRDFVRHLVFDLRAPLASQDAKGDTCLHVAAEHGHSADVLATLLACDVTDSIREIRNFRGFTVLEVAKPHLKVAFGINAKINRSVSSASARTIKPSTTSLDSSQSLFRTEVLRRRVFKVPVDVDMHDSLSDLNIQLFPHCILENLLITSRQLCLQAEDPNVSEIEELLQKTEDMGEDLLVHMQARLNDVSEELQSARQKISATRLSVQELEQTANAENDGLPAALENGWGTPGSPRRRTTDSKSSGWTAVSSRETSNKVASDSASALYPHDFSDSGIALPEAFCETSFTASTSPPPTPPAANVLRPTKSMVDLGRTSDIAPEDRGFLKLFASWTKEGTRPRSRTHSQTSAETVDRSSILLREPRESAASGMSRVKAWFKRRLMSEVAVPSTVAENVEDSSPSSDLPTHQEDNRDPPPQSIQQRAARDDVSSALNVLRATNRDLTSIQEDIETAEHYADHTGRSIAQARQLLARSLENRRVQCLHAKRLLGPQCTSLPASNPSESLEFPPVTIPTSPRDSQLVFPKPPNVLTSMSILSLSSTLVEEDDDARALRRLITRKIEARTDHALEYTNKSLTGLRIVKDITRTLRRNMSS